MNLTKIASWDLSMLVWGYELAGESDFTAILAENPHWNSMPTGQPMWDKTIDWTARVVRIIDDVQRPVPLHWCLPWVTEHRLRKELI